MLESFFKMVAGFRHALQLLDFCDVRRFRRGNVTRKQAPFSDGSNVKVPPESGIIFSLMASPSPLLRPWSFVVKNASKISSRNSAGTPGPSS